MPVTPNITLAGKLIDIFGSDALGASMLFQLCGFGTQIPRVPGTAMLGSVSTLLTGLLEVACPNGTYDVQLWGNDQITPSGTYYTITLKDCNGNVIQCMPYQFAGVVNDDLSNIAPFLPSPPAPVPVTVVGGLALLTGAAATANGAQAVTFKYTLTADSVLTFINANPGVRYTFLVVQDGAGGHALTWPGNIKNALSPLLVADSVTVFSFVADDLGNLYPTGPASDN